MGTEVEGRSRVISTDLMDTIESMLPSLLKPFTSSTEVVEFDPVGPEDEAAIAAVAYKGVRRAAYPEIGSQLDALWKGGDDQAAMKVLVDKVKSDNPKP